MSDARGAVNVHADLFLAGGPEVSFKASVRFTIKRPLTAYAAFQFIPKHLIYHAVNVTRRGIRYKINIIQH